MEEDPQGRLKYILDHDFEDSGMQNCSSKNDEASDIKDCAEGSTCNQDGYNFQCISTEHLAILKKLSQKHLLMIFDKAQGGQSLDEAIKLIAFDVYNQIKQAAEDQYKTLEVDTHLKTSIEKPEGFLCPINDRDDNFLSLRYMKDDSRSEYFLHVAQFIPLRLTYEERRFLLLLESALEVSEYVDKIDVMFSGNKARRIANELRQICAILSGLVIAHNYEDGQKLVRDREYSENADFFRTIFEIGRRYKILNPERMRSSYGKLLYLLMDSRKYEVYELLQINLVANVNTVYKFLESKKNGLELLKDPLVEIATMEIESEGKSRNQIQKEIQRKEKAIKDLAEKYATKISHKKHHGLFGFNFTFFSSSPNYCNNNSGSDDDDNEDTNDGLTSDDIQQVLYSIGDHNAYLKYNRNPCDQMIMYLQKFFLPQQYEEEYCLAITAGKAGARLTHNHTRQYMYVLQSLALWREISHEMFMLWHLAEADLLDSKNSYRLRDTGQGLHRVQEAPRVLSAMNQIINRVQKKLGGWIGSSIIHLGDHNVPNALMFVDKYTQVPRILNPIVLCLQKIDEMCESKPTINDYVKAEFGGKIQAKKRILCDFFRHGFDGSGADNFYDAGSCIDGRLTSAWNWCSQIEKKNFFPLFLLTGFTGFDGRF